MTQQTCDLLLTGGTVVTADDEWRVLDPGAVAVTGSVITAVGTPEELADHTARRTVDCTGRVVIPGLVDCHNHLFQLLGRGLGEGMALWPWLSTFMWPYAGGITREEAVAGVTVGALEAARSGTTCVVDNHYAPSDVQTVLAVAAAVDEVGLRGVIARGMTGEKTQVAIDGRLSDALFRYSDEEEVAMTQECIAARRGTRVEVWPAPLNVIYNTQDLVRRAVELARAEGTRWHTHCSEAEADPQIYLDAYGCGRSSGCTRRACSARRPPSPMPSGSTTPRSRRWARPAPGSATTRSPTSTSRPERCACGTPARRAPRWGWAPTARRGTAPTCSR